MRLYESSKKRASGSISIRWMKYQVWILNVDVDVDVVGLIQRMNAHTHTMKDNKSLSKYALFSCSSFIFHYFSYLFLNAKVNWKTINRKIRSPEVYVAFCTGSAVTMCVRVCVCQRQHCYMSSQWTEKETQNEFIYKFCNINQTL